MGGGTKNRGSGEEVQRTEGQGRRYKEQRVRGGGTMRGSREVYSERFRGGHTRRVEG